MAVFPGGIVSLTNPTSGDELNTAVVLHSVQHATVNDEVEAIETELGANPSGSEATVAARFTAVEADVTAVEGDVATLTTTVAALPGGDARVFDAVFYGAEVDGTTDDTVAWQDAIDAAAAAGGGIVTSSLNGVSVIAGALQDTGGANAQLLLPAVDAADTEQMAITIRGLTPAPTVVSLIGATPIPDGHLVLKSTLASGTGAVIGAQGPVGTYSGFTNVHLQVENLTVRTVSNPTITALDLRQVASVDLDRVVVDCGNYYVGGLTEPTSTGSYGIRLPKNNNGAHTRLGMVDVVGFYTGYEFAEHSTGVKVAAWGCKVAAEFDASNHASTFLRFMAVWCERGLKFTGAHPVDVWQFDIEHAASGWYETIYDLDDASNYGKGFLRWHAVLAGTGDHNSFTVNGGSGFTTSRVGAALGSGGGGSLAVQDENGTAITGVTQLDFQGAGVTAASGTGEVVVTIPGGSGYVYRDRLVAAGGDDELTLGAVPVANSPLVWVDGVIQWPTTDYTISSNVISFNTPLSASDVVAVQYHSAASSASASVLASGGVNIVDNFNRADSSSALGSTSTGGNAWTQHVGTWGISANLAYCSNGSASQVNVATVDSGVTDCTMSATVLRSVSGGPVGGFCFRVDATGANFYLAEVTVNGAGTPVIWKNVAGTYTQLAVGASTTVATGSVLTLEIVGNLFTLKDDGATIVSVTDSTFPTPTRHGMYVSAPAGVTSTFRFDDFSIQP